MNEETKEFLATKNTKELKEIFLYIFDILPEKDKWQLLEDWANEMMSSNGYWDLLEK